jgi:gluconolactonase
MDKPEKLTLTEFSSPGRIFSKNGEIRRLATGFHFTEGPVWDIKGDCLYFTDFQHDLICRWAEGTGALPYRERGNRPVGLSMAADGRIIAAETSAHRVAYADSRESVTIAGSFEGKILNSPNDVVAARDGTVFFTDPYSKAMNGPRELGFNGVFAADPQGKIRLIDGRMDRPNGIAFSPDESILYVNDTDRQHILAFGMGKDGSAAPLGVFARLDPSYGRGVPDGMKVDLEGNVYVTGPGGLWVLSPGGAPLVILHTPEFVGNFCFGGRDSRTIFLAASSSIYALPAEIPGIVPCRD